MDTPTPLPPVVDPSPAPPPPPTPGSAEASYFEKLLLFIPADMVAGYLALDGILKQSLDITIWIYWAVFLAMLALTPLYICFKPSETSILKCSRRFRVITGTIAFAVWIFALGGPFAVTFLWYKPVFGSLLLIVTTLAIPVFEKMASRFNI
jgi:hypothetical protein